LKGGGIALENGVVEGGSKVAMEEGISSTNQAGNLALNVVSGENCTGREEDLLGAVNFNATPASGINLISVSDNSLVADSVPQVNTEEKDKFVEAAKLLSIQREVRFTFEEPTDDTLKQLVDQERCDRAKKLEWEQKDGDQ
jgi:hypothetical protein